MLPLDEGNNFCLFSEHDKVMIKKKRIRAVLFMFAIYNKLHQTGYKEVLAFWNSFWKNYKLLIFFNVIIFKVVPSFNVWNFNTKLSSNLS